MDDGLRVLSGFKAIRRFSSLARAFEEANSSSTCVPTYEPDEDFWEDFQKTEVRLINVPPPAWVQMQVQVLREEVTFR